MFEVEKSIYGFAVGIKAGNNRVLSLVEGAERNEENIGLIVDLLNKAGLKLNDPKKHKVTSVPKPRGRLIVKAYVQWIAQKRCLYCGEQSGPPHHVRWGEGPGKGSASRKPDDYRVIPVCHLCHDALEGGNRKRLKWMAEKVGREDVYLAMLDNLIEWIALGRGR